jgi:Flp pilus assembly protein TadD
LADAFNNLGVAYAKQGNFVAAEQAMRQAATIDPEYYKKKMEK